MKENLKLKTDIILYLIIKSIHIIFVVSYFAGLFYIVRLLIYHTEALQGKEGQERDILHKQYSFMEERLWNIITVPALVIVLVSGIYPLQLGQATYGQWSGNPIALCYRLCRGAQGLIPTILVGYPLELRSYGRTDYGRSKNCQQKIEVSDQ